MVESWIKRELIKNFFELLAEDGAADLRRLNYWLKWEPHISDMWFVLGADSTFNRRSEFVDFRKRMEGRGRKLGGATSNNNAFIMRIGQLLVIEFGITGNACFVFAASDFITDLDTPILSIYDLKQKSGSTKLSHSGSWEYKFTQALKQKLQSVPLARGKLINSRDQAQPGPLSEQKNSSTINNPQLSQEDFRVLQILCIQFGIKLEDNRDAGGNLWVLLEDRNRLPMATSKLEKMGFTYKEGKGFWINDKA